MIMMVSFGFAIYELLQFLQNSFDIGHEISYILLIYRHFQGKILYSTRLTETLKQLRTPIWTQVFSSSL